MCIRRLALPLSLPFLLAACQHPEPPPTLKPLPRAQNLAVAGPLVNGSVGSPEATPPVQVSYGASTVPALPAAREGEAGGDITLDFADTDLREVVAQVLGTILRVNYTIDPAVHGVVTMHTAHPVARSQLLPLLQALLVQNGAVLLQSGSLYRVVPAAAAANSTDPTPGVSNDSVIVPLRFASADDLAKVLQQYAGTGGKIVADPGHNTLLLSGDPATRAALVELVRAFDIDVLAGQSYALLPVTSGDPKDFASALQDALRGQGGGSAVRIVPMARVNAVMVVAPTQVTIESVRRVYAMVERARSQTIRGWHVYYLQNSRANDAAYVLQQAFTPDNVTAQPSAKGPTTPGLAAQASAGGSSMGGGSRLGGGSGIGGGTGSGFGSGGGGTGGLASAGLGSAAPAAATAQAPVSNPLLGGLSPQAGGESKPDSMRIIPNEDNNALLIYGTRREEDTVEATLRKIDVVPLQVLIDAVIAEVTLNDALQYGTQFYFRSHGINGILNFAQQAFTTQGAVSFATGFPGLVVGGSQSSGVPFAISALQQVTTVHVLSSPQLLVLDNQQARLQVGDVVPYLTQTSQSTITANAPTVNSINYQPTGVILEVTPRVNSGGLVTLDIAQEVSEANTPASTDPIQSPTFHERNVTSRVVVQDGQTLGLAGLIQDSVQRSNGGIPWLKDIPLLGALVSQQTNTRARTELLVLITPHVIHDQRDSRALTEDLREQLINAAAVPAELKKLPPAGSADPNQQLRRRLGLD